MVTTSRPRRNPMICRSLLSFRNFSCSITLLVCACSFSKSNAHETCPVPMYSRADSLLVDARSSWPALLEHQRRFGACDDGYLAEGYSDAVAILFAKKWNQFGEFVDISRGYPAFERWAIRHINETNSPDDLIQIMFNASKCIGNARTIKLCKEIRRAASNALVEIEKIPAN